MRCPNDNVNENDSQLRKVPMLERAPARDFPCRSAPRRAIACRYALLFHASGCDTKPANDSRNVAPLSLYRALGRAPTGALLQARSNGTT